MPALRHEIDAGQISDAPARLSALRQLLADKFPAAEGKPGGIWPTGFGPLDAVEGGIRRGALTELSATPAGGALFTHLILHSVVHSGAFAALIDAGGTFDPDSYPPEALARLLRVDCPDATTAMKAADLLLRDGNLPVLILDLQRLTRLQIAQAPASTWHRFQRLAEQTSVACLILTRQPLVESARVRITLHGSWSLASQRKRRVDLLSELRVQVVPRRTAGPSLTVVPRE